MNDLQQKAFKNMLKGLEGLGCSYMVIDPDGGEYKYGDVWAPTNKKIKRPPGELLNHYWPFMKDLQPGQMAEVPVGPYTINEVQTGMCAKALSSWGAGSYVTSRDVDKQIVNILRAY